MLFHSLQTLLALLMIFKVNLLGIILDSGRMEK